MIEIVAERDRPGSFVVRVDGTDQSHVDLDDPTYLAFDYMRRIADVIDTCAEPGVPIRIVHIGGAGLTLPRYVAATRPRSSQIVLEPDEELTTAVRRDLPLPPRSGIKVRGTDGAAGIGAIRDDHADLVILDAYAEAQVPAELTAAGFVSDVARILSSGGWFVLNLADHAPFAYVRRAVGTLGLSFATVTLSAEPATLKGRRFGNVLLMAGQGPDASDRLVRRAAGSAFPYRVLDAAEVRTSFGGGRPFVEGDVGASPKPPGGLAAFS